MSPFRSEKGVNVQNPYVATPCYNGMGVIFREYFSWVLKSGRLRIYLYVFVSPYLSEGSGMTCYIPKPYMTVASFLSRYNGMGVIFRKHFGWVLKSDRMRIFL